VKKSSTERTPVLAPFMRAILGALLLAQILTLPAAANPCDIRYGSLCGDCDDDVGAIPREIGKELAQAHALNDCPDSRSDSTDETTIGRSALKPGGDGSRLNIQQCVE
jgi:hypothetical protein